MGLTSLTLVFRRGRGSETVLSVPFCLQGLRPRALREKDFWAAYFLFVFQGQVPVAELLENGLALA